MSVIETLEQEVLQEVDDMTAEVILALMDKWEADVARDIKYGRASIPDLLRHYVRLKIAWHHVKRHIEYHYDGHDSTLYNERTQHYTKLITEARRNYYVTKRRYEGEHASDCPCRGCRCLKEFDRSRQDESQDSSGGT